MTVVMGKVQLINTHRDRHAPHVVEAELLGCHAPYAREQDMTLNHATLVAAERSVKVALYI